MSQTQTKKDYVIEQLYKEISCLPEPLNTNQFLAAVFADFMSNEFFYSLPNTTSYAYIEGLFSLFCRLLINDEFYYARHRYLADYLYGDVSLDKFARVIRSPLVYFKNKEQYEHYHRSNFIHETLRFFEVVILLSFLGTKTFGIYDYKSKYNAFDNYEDLVNKTCDKLCQHTNNCIFEYFVDAHALSEIIGILLTENEEERLNRAEFLNVVHYHVHENPNVHSSIKNALHIYL
jgi:hypothetical protein